jgi:tRNA(Ile)-lysidine synthase
MFDPQILHQHLKTHHISTAQLWVAYSGGVDSHVLLHSLASLRPLITTTTTTTSAAPALAAAQGGSSAAASASAFSLHAIHIHHGLNPHADAWSQHCQRICAALQIECIIKKINVAQHAKHRSIEEVARELRYQAIIDVLPEDGYLLTGHTQDDQAETVLQQLFRGAGVKGLAAMPQVKPLGRGRLLRPLLGVSRAELLAYAQAAQLQWIEDDSNQDCRFERNYLRNEVLPSLNTRWPAIKPVLARVAEHCAQASELLEDLAREDERLVRGAVSGTLSVTALNQLSPAHQNNVLRFWLAQLGLQITSTVLLEQLRRNFLQSRTDCMPHMRWWKTEVRRYGDCLYAGAPLLPFDNKMVIPWNMQQP